MVEALARPVSSVLAAEGREGLDALPGVGPRIAGALAELVLTGRWSQLDRVQGETEPERLFRTIPGIGAELARRLVHELHLASLEALETAAHDGSLALAAGWGPCRGRLRRISPKRFNPHGEAWLPILHSERGAWRFTALYSNTPLAHQLGRTRDWVVIYYETDASPEGQCTVVTETTGRRKGQRVVRGREAEAG